MLRFSKEMLTYFRHLAEENRIWLLRFFSPPRVSEWFLSAEGKWGGALVAEVTVSVGTVQAGRVWRVPSLFLRAPSQTPPLVYLRSSAHDSDVHQPSASFSTLCVLCVPGKRNLFDIATEVYICFLDFYPFKLINLRNIATRVTMCCASLCFKLWVRTH